MSRSLYESLMAGEPSGGAEGLMAAFATAAARVRAQRETGLAQAEFEEGYWVDLSGEPWLDADLDDLALAARDTADLDFPVRYSGGGFTVLLGLDEDGGAYALLEAGDGVVQVLGVVLSAGVEVRVDLETPPGELQLGNGTVLRP